MGTAGDLLLAEAQVPTRPGGSPWQGRRLSLSSSSERVSSAEPLSLGRLLGVC